MKVKIGDVVYSGEKEPVMVVLDDADKKNIANMLEHATKYCVYPDTARWVSNDFAGIKKWMETDTE